MKRACPACREPISIGASICPFCQTRFSEDEIRQRTSASRWNGLIFVIVAVFAVVAWLQLGGAERLGEMEAQGWP